MERTGYRGSSPISNTSLQDPAVALCLGTYGDPGGVGVSHGQGTPVRAERVGRPRASVEFRVQGLEIGVWGLEFRVWDLEFRV